MDRNREVRRGSMAASNGLARRRQRSSGLRDSPEDDVAMEMQETTRLRDRKKDRDRLSRSKRRRADRLMHGSNREDGGEDSTEESLDDDEEDEDEEAGPIRMPPPNLASSSLSNNHHRKSFPPAKVVRAAPWKVSDEMGFSVPKKARSASAKRSHEWLISGGGGGVSGGGGGGGGGEQLHRQASTSPARPPSVTISLPAPTSPSSSSVSLKKKLKPMGQKHRPPKISNKPASNQDEIEIEVAEVLYGLMRQSQCPSSATNSSQKLDSKEMNGSTTDARSRVSSPISASPSYPPQQQLKLPQNPSSSSTASVSAIAPKRKRPRVVKYEEESSSIFAVRNCSTASAGKIENEPSGKVGASSPKLEKNSGSPVDNNGGIALNSGSSQAPAPAPAPAVLSESPPPESAKPESNTILDSKPVTEQSEIRDGVQSKEVVVIPSSQKESPSVKMDIEPEDTTTTKAISTASGVQNHREENFKIDLMAPPSKSSPERDNAFDFGSDLKPNASTYVEMTQKVETEVKAEEKVDKLSNHDTREVGLLEKKTEGVVDECESQKSIASKQMGLDLQLDLQMPNKDSDPNPTSSNKPQIQNQQHHHHQQQPPLVPRNEPKLEKEAQSATMPLPMTAAGWPGGLPPMGCGTGQVRPLQGVVSLDGNPGSSNAMQPPHFILSQPRPKRCTYHYDIARNIYYHQQYARMNPYIAAAGGSASIYGTKPYNLNVLPPAETAIMGNPLQGSFPGRNSTQEKSQVEVVKDKSSVASNFMDPAPKKQIVLQQAPPQMHAPAFIFHLSQQQAAAVASNKSGAVKSQATGNPSSATSAQSAPGNSSSTAGTAPTLSFNYQNLAGSEGQQYLAILQNNGYPYPVPAQVGSLPHYRSGAPSQAMPFFNGSFYSSQMLHPSQLQQQQQLQSQSQQQPGQQSHQNTSTSSGSSSSQKHQHTQQNQQQRLPGDGSNVCGGNSNSFPASKNRSQQHQQNQSVPVIHQGRQLDTDMVVEDCSEGSRVSQGHKTVYGHNYGMQIHPKNFASMSSAALAGGSSGNHGGDKQQAQQQNSKGGELVPAQAFAMPFASFNGGTAVPGFDMSQNHLIFQSLPEAARHGYPQMAAAMAAAQAAQQKRTNPFSEESKTVSDSNIADDDRKAMTGKGPSIVGQALVFSRPDTNGPSTILGSSVVDSSARNLNLISAPSNVNRTSRSSNPTTGPMAGASTASNASNPQLQQQHQQLIQLQKQHQQQQMQQQQQQMQQQLHQQQQQLQHQHQQQLLQQQQLHLQQQQQMQQQQQQQLQHQLAAAAVTRSKPSNTTNASVYSDRLSSSPMAGKFPNALSVFPQALIQGGSPTQSPQWKNSTRTTASSASSASSLVSNPSSLKNHHPQQQQQGRTQQGHTQISFGANNPSKPGTVAHGQQIPTNNQSPSSPVVVGSPPRSISKSAGGSPRTTSTGSKVGPTPSLSSQQHAKNSSSGPSRKSSPVGGRNVPSILGNSHVTSSPSSNAKAQSQHQQQQKQTLQQQTQIFFTGAYGQAQSPQSTTSTTANTSTSAIGYYHQRRQEQQQQQQQHGSSNTSSSGMLSLCSPLALAGVTTSDPTKVAASAAVANNMKGGVPSPAVFHASQLATQSSVHPFMAAFPYIHVPTVQPKPAEQKQPTGNDNLHACWQPEKR